MGRSCSSVSGSATAEDHAQEQPEHQPDRDADAGEADGRRVRVEQSETGAATAPMIIPAAGSAVTRSWRTRRRENGLLLTAANLVARGPVPAQANVARSRVATRSRRLRARSRSPSRK